MTRSWLVVERAGALWAIPREKLRHLGRGPVLILEPDRRIAVDDVHAVLRDPRPVALGRQTARLLPEPVVGIGLWNDRPLAFLDPDVELPSCLRLPDGSGAP